MEHSAVCISGEIIVGLKVIIGERFVTCCTKSADLNIGGLDSFEEGPLLFV